MKSNSDLGKLSIERKTGDELFHANGKGLNVRLQNFWQWSSSDLVGNALRGVLAEYIVGTALGLVDGVRQEWNAFDLLTKNGIKIEVKSAAYIQSWAQNRLSSIMFSIMPSLGWDANTNEYSSERRRQADIYVFALLKHQDKQTADPLDVDHWEFYVLPTAEIDRSMPLQKTISLSTLKRLNPEQVTYHELAQAVESVSGRATDK